MAKYLVSALLLVTLIFQPLTPVATGLTLGEYSHNIQVNGIKNAIALKEIGVIVFQQSANVYIASVTDSQFQQIEAKGIPITTFGLMTQSIVPQDAATLVNPSLIVGLQSTGQFTMQEANQQRYLLFPGGWTSYLSVNVDGAVYTNNDGSLSIDTPLTTLNTISAYILYRTPENVVVTLTYTLMGQALQLKIDTKNEDTISHQIKVRYLWDTQVDVNDGSPLYAPPSGVRTSETDFNNPSFTNWSGYDTWPNPTLVSTGVMPTIPYRVVFAYWPNAYVNAWDYTIDPNKAFYTPGYVTSPYSDSSVLEYYALGNLSSYGTGEIVTYYGLGSPDNNQTGRDRLISALNNNRSAVENFLINDVTTYSTIMATYYDAMQVKLDAKWFVQSAWTVFGPEPGDKATRAVKLLQDFDALEKIGDIVSLIDYSSQLGVSTADLFSSIPSGTSIEEIANNYFKPYIMNTHMFGNYQGINGVIQAIDNQYQNVVNALPSPLPNSYPVDNVVASLNSQTTALKRASYQETWAPFLSPNSCMPDVKAGVMNSLYSQLLGQIAQINTADSWSWGLTLTEMGVWGLAGSIKIASIAGVATIPVGEAVFWGTTGTIAAIPSIMGTAATVISLTNKGALTSTAYSAVGQLSSDISMINALYLSTLRYVNPSNMTLASLNNQVSQAISPQAVADNLLVQTVSVPDVIVPDTIDYANGTGSVTLTNTGVSPLTISLNGNITAQRGEDITIVGLVGTETSSLQPGETQSFPFSFTILRSGLVNYLGYDLHLFVNFAQTGTAVRGALGPTVVHFSVGTQEQLQGWNHISTNLGHGQVTSGSTYSQSFQVTAGAQASRLMLSFPEGSDLDLHLYDSYGRHTGMNYQTGRVENQIPGVVYSGMSAWPEWLMITAPTTEIYQVQVVGNDISMGGYFDIQQLDIMTSPAMIDIPHQLGWTYMRLQTPTLQGENFAFTIHEVGGTMDIANLTLLPSNLQDSQGHSIPSNQIVCSSTPNLLAGTENIASCVVNVSASTLDGVYTGLITVTGQDTQGATMSVNSNVILTVTTAHDNATVYLPIMIR